MCACHCLPKLKLSIDRRNVRKELSMTSRTMTPWCSIAGYSKILQRSDPRIREAPKCKAHRHRRRVRCVGVYIVHNSSPRATNEPWTPGHVRSRREGAKSVTFATRSRRRAISYIQKCRGTGAKPKYTYYRVRRTHRNAVTSAATVISAPSFPPSVSATRPSTVMGVEREGWLSLLPFLVLAAAPWQEPPCVTEGQSRFHRRNAYTFPELETERVT